MIKRYRIDSIDVLRGLVMVVMALDHVRDYFHRDAFFYEPTDLGRTTLILFFTRWVTHFCAPVFVFLAGMSAWLYGAKKTKKELSHFLVTRGIWLIIVELLIISLGRTFNPMYRMINLQVIWAIGVSMIVLSLLIHLKRWQTGFIAVLLIVGHHLLDGMHVPGNGFRAFCWALLHETRDFSFGGLKVFVHYPLIPWIGLIALGYFFGSFYDNAFDPARRIKTFFLTGLSMIFVFFFLRILNAYGDPSPWTVQKNIIGSFLSILNVSKYPPSLLYTLITIGPAILFLSVVEIPLNRVSRKLAVFGRVPFFYYVIHLYLIHLLATIAALANGYPLQVMILTDRVNRVPELKGYGFSLPVVYLVWIGLVLILYPFCKWFDVYKRNHQAKNPWLSYI